MERPVKNCWGIILAAGTGTRLAEATGGVRKQYLEYNSAPLFWHSARTFSRVAGIQGLIFVFPPEDVQRMEKKVRLYFKAEDLGVRWAVCAGGERRQDSVRLGIDALPSRCDAIMVHDSARPFMTASLVHDLLDALNKGAQGVVPVVKVTDTIKQVHDNEVTSTLPREALRSVQTPQAFDATVLRNAHEQAVVAGWEATDDASLVERIAKVIVIPGERTNCKVTNPEDLQRLEKAKMAYPVVGWGYDVHRFGSPNDRPFILGGVPIQGGPTIVAHSDGDVLLHALTDAVLGTFGGGDIGSHFPDTDPEYAGIESGILLKESLALAAQAGVKIVHVDTTVITQIPKLAPHAVQIRKNLCRLLGLEASQVNFKATTEEKLGFTGAKAGIKAVATVTGLRDS